MASQTYKFDKTCSDYYSVFECLKRWNKHALTKLELWLRSNILFSTKFLNSSLYGNEEGIHELFPGIVNNTSIKTLKICIYIYIYILVINAFGDSIPAAKDLADAVNVNKSLEHLVLARNGMSDEGAKLIKEGIVESKNPNFIKATITDEEVKIYPMIIKDNLTILELSNISLIKSNISII